MDQKKTSNRVGGQDKKSSKNKGLKPARGQLEVVQHASKKKLTGRQFAEKRRMISMLLKKHNAVIHIEGSIGLLERKLYNILLLNAFDELDQQGRTHAMPVWMLCELSGFDSKDLDRLKKAIHALQSTVLEVNLLQDGKVRWESMTLLAYARIENGICSYRYDEAVAQRLKRPEVYTSINLEVQRNFGSSYALALYENCVRFREVGSTGMMDVDWWRLTLGAHEDASYRDFKAFRRRCIDPAVREINDLSDIRVEPRFEREGRTIARIGFFVTKTQQIKLIGADIDDPLLRLRQSSLYLKLRQYGLPDQIIVMYLQHDHRRAEAAVRYFERQSAQDMLRIRNKAAYIRALIESGVDLEQDDQTIDRAARSTISEMLKQREQADEQTRIFAERARAVRAWISSLSVDDLRDLWAIYCEESGRKDPSGLGDDGMPGDSADRLIFQAWLRSRCPGEEALPAPNTKI